MAHKRFIPRRYDTPRPSRPFGCAEEAWFWFVRSQEARRDGARFVDCASAFQRPCDPDDIYRAVLGLARDGRIGRSHLHVLGRFGLIGKPPDRRCPEQVGLAPLWEEALDRLATVLRGKGILA